MSGEWPPRGMVLPGIDPADVRAVGWDLDQMAEGEHAGSYVLQAGHCGDHFALIFPPGARIIHHEDGTLEMDGVVVSGHGQVSHDPDCPSAG